jgi:hypothetical protein
MRESIFSRRTSSLRVFGAVALMLAFAGQLLAPGANASMAGSVEIVSPADGGQVTSGDIDVQVKVSDFTVDCTKAGMRDEDGVGHIHAMIDGMSMAQLSNFYCSDTFTISGVGLTAGEHTLVVDLATNTHLDMADTVKEVTFDYQPATVQPLPEPNDQGEPSVKLVSPEDGATVPAKFTIEVEAVNFTPTDTLEGKANVPGFGHYHVFVDTDMSMMGEEMGGTPEMDMMGTPEHEMDMEGTPTEEMMEGTAETGMEGMGMAMAGMILMPGTNSFEVDLTAWGPGEHTIWIEPVQNDHTQFETFGHVEFHVTVQE